MLHDILFDFAQLRMRIHIVHMTEQLMLSQLVPACTVATDTNADEACAAALTLRLVDSMHDAFANTVQIASCFAYTFKISRQAVLNVFVLTAAAFENETYFNIVAVPIARNG